MGIPRNIEGIRNGLGAQYNQPKNEQNAHISREGSFGFWKITTCDSSVSCPFSSPELSGNPRIAQVSGEAGA